MAREREGLAALPLPPLAEAGYFSLKLAAMEDPSAMVTVTT